MTKQKTYLYVSQAYDSEYLLGLDCWTSPNHHPWMSFNVLQLCKAEDGKEEPVIHLLDFVELPCSHTGLNLARCVAKVLKEYGIENKVSTT